MRSTVEALPSLPPPTEKEVLPHIRVNLQEKSIAVNGVVIKVPPSKWEAFLELAKKPGEDISGKDLVYEVKAAYTREKGSAGHYLKTDLNKKTGFELITRSGPLKRSYYSLNAEVEMVEEASIQERPFGEKGILDARLIEPPGELPLKDGPQETKNLVERVVGGDAESFGELYELYVDRVYRHIYFRVGRTEDAKDMTSQVFLNAWNAMPRYKDMGRPFVVWLLSIAHNLLTDYYRAKRDTTNIEGVVISDVNPENDPVTASGKALENEGLRKAIGKLKKRDQQSVVVMRYIDEMEYPEIAAVLNKSEGAVRVILHRALLNLRSIMRVGEVTVLPREENGTNGQSTEQRFSYRALANVLGMNRMTLWQSVVTAEKRGQLKLSTNPNPGGWNGKFRFTRKDVAAVLTFLGKDPSLAAKL